ncbi:MAG TPA: response regulator [Nitrososphaeraceae archaeon]|nr:response regulator [Nitrososphaeraceae archaeon]
MVRKLLVGIIDDESDIVNLFRDALSKIDGLSIFTFTDPMAALEHFKINKDAYALLISDLRMPGISGIDLVYKIKKKNPLVRTLLMTAFEVDDKVFEEYVNNDIIDGFIQKPVKLRYLLSEVLKQVNIYKRIK